METTTGITREDVESALDYFGIDNPKPEIPLEQTLTGHEIVAVARGFQALEARITALEENES